MWGTVSCPHQGGPITGYTLRYSDGTSLVNTTGEGSRQHVFTGLTPFTSYSVQVAAVNDGGTGPYSEPALTVETLQDGKWFTIMYLNSKYCLYCMHMGATACILYIYIYIMHKNFHCVLMQEYCMAMVWQHNMNFIDKRDIVKLHVVLCLRQLFIFCSRVQVPVYKYSAFSVI